MTWPHIFSVRVRLSPAFGEDGAPRPRNGRRQRPARRPGPWAPSFVLRGDDDGPDPSVPLTSCSCGSAG